MVDMEWTPPTRALTDNQAIHTPQDPNVLTKDLSDLNMKSLNMSALSVLSALNANPMFALSALNMNALPDDPTAHPMDHPITHPPMGLMRSTS